MTSTADRNRAIKLVDEARREGARLKAAMTPHWCCMPTMAVR